MARDEFATALAPACYDPQTQIVVATPRFVRREWRLVVAGDQIVAGSQYFDSGKLAVARGIPNSARSFADQVLASIA